MISKDTIGNEKKALFKFLYTGKLDKNGGYILYNLDCQIRGEKNPPKPKSLQYLAVPPKYLKYDCLTLNILGELLGTGVT